MKKLFFAVLVVGILLGPGYYIYCTQFCGQDYGQHLIFQQQITKQKSGDEFYYKKSGAVWNSPIYVSLDPNMNPITFETEIHYYKPIEYAEHTSRFFSQLSKNHQTIWQKEFYFCGGRKNYNSKKGVDIRINSPAKATGHTIINTFNVQHAGKYKLSMIENKSSQLAISKINLHIRGNFKEPNQLAVKAGGLLMMVSILLLIGHGVVKKLS